MWNNRLDEKKRSELEQQFIQRKCNLQDMRIDFKFFNEFK